MNCGLQGSSVHGILSLTFSLIPLVFFGYFNSPEVKCSNMPQMFIPWLSFPIIIFSIWVFIHSHAHTLDFFFFQFVWPVLFFWFLHYCLTLCYMDILYCTFLISHLFYYFFFFLVNFFLVVLGISVNIYEIYNNKVQLNTKLI